MWQENRFVYNQWYQYWAVTDQGFRFGKVFQAENGTMTLVQHGSVWNSSGNILIFVIRASSRQSWKYSPLNKPQMYNPNTINVQRFAYVILPCCGQQWSLVVWVWVYTCWLFPVIFVSFLIYDIKRFNSLNIYPFSLIQIHLAKPTHNYGSARCQRDVQHVQIAACGTSWCRNR